MMIMWFEGGGHTLNIKRDEGMDEMGCESVCVCVVLCCVAKCRQDSTKRGIYIYIYMRNRLTSVVYRIGNYDWHVIEWACGRGGREGKETRRNMKGN